MAGPVTTLAQTFERKQARDMQQQNIDRNFAEGQRVNNARLAIQQNQLQRGLDKDQIANENRLALIDANVAGQLLQDPATMRDNLLQMQSRLDPESDLASLDLDSFNDEQLMGALAMSRALGTAITGGQPGDFAAQLTEAVDASGNPVFVQASKRGGAQVVPGITPPGPSAREQIQTQIAEENLAQEVAQTEEAERKATAAASTKDDISSLASSILDSGDYVDVFGAIQGAIPSVQQETVDAEADVDRLVSLLTLENTGKMSGVLSESDIKILRDAGTILGNKRISDTKAKEELEKIADVFARNQDRFNSPVIETQEDYDALPSGAMFIEIVDGQEQLFVKP